MYKRDTSENVTRGFKHVHDISTSNIEAMGVTKFLEPAHELVTVFVTYQSMVSNLPVFYGI
jgi:hypothetical protein